jgi:3-deoxy-D-manno-octulosonic-acid transferase
MVSITAPCRPALGTRLLARLPLRLRLAGFGLLERLAGLRGSQGPALVLPPASGGPRALWVFVSTIGELNAIEPFLNQLLQALGQPPLLLISDRGLYAEAYRAKYPQALLASLSGTQAEAAALAARQPPLLLLVAEIPALLHDAPCRFSFATVQAARRAGAPVVLANGWLYGYAPPSRMDRIEHALFAADYLRAFDLLLVQTEPVRQALLQAGATPERVVVTGNIKFDAMDSAYGLPASAQGPGSLHQQLLARAGRGPVIVAGSVTETADQRALLAAFAQVLAAHPQALLVLAPRHPENQPRMAALRGLLAEMAGGALAHRFRSACDTATAVDTSVLVLDTMGELRGCYAAATLAFVGTDHNVLEPLAFGKPVFVGPGWERTYPSYPVYQQLLAAGVLQAVPQLPALGEAWLRWLGSPHHGAADTQHCGTLLRAAGGASQRHLAAMRRQPALAALLAPPGPAESR